MTANNLEVFRDRNLFFVEFSTVEFIAFVERVVWEIIIDVISLKTIFFKGFRKSTQFHTQEMAK